MLETNTSFYGFGINDEEKIVLQFLKHQTVHNVPMVRDDAKEVTAVTLPPPVKIKKKSSSAKLTPILLPQQPVPVTIVQQPRTQLQPGLAQICTIVEQELRAKQAWSPAPKCVDKECQSTSRCPGHKTSLPSSLML